MNTSIEKAPTVMRLEQVWNLVALSPLQPKQHGQLKCLRNKCGPDTQHIIEFVLHGWPEFTDHVRQQTGYESVPPLPHVGFLLKFYQVAVAMMADTCPERVAHVLTAAAVTEAEWARECQEERGDTTAVGFGN